MNKVQILSTALCASLLIVLVVNPESLAAPTDAFEQLRLRASAWFKSTDKKARRKEMRAMTRALKQPCKYCHTAGFKGYTDRHQVTLEMMALSVEHDVECKDCHLGKDALSSMGTIAKGMELLAKQEAASCGDCHVQKAKFKTLTPRGKKYKDEHPDLLLKMKSREAATQ